MNERSKLLLSTCHDDLILIITESDKEYPLQVICGERNKFAQDDAFKRGVSKLKYPESMHNVNVSEGRLKSHAVDIVPDPDNNPKSLDWRDTKAFLDMLTVVENVAKKHKIRLRFGRDFKKLKDFPHVELANKKP